MVTDYLLDLQPGLTKVLAQTTSGNTERFVHGPHGIHAMEDNSGNWTWPVQDGLGSVRGVVSNTLAVNGMQHYAPYGDPFGTQGSLGMDFGFTGEQTDGTGQVYLRARYYNPSMGVFTALDPFEGMMQRPMSLNGYLYVEGDPIMNTDPSGRQRRESRCTGRSCQSLEYDIANALLGYFDKNANWVKGIWERVEDLFTDKCCLYEFFLPQAQRKPCTPHPDCLDATGLLKPDVGTWEGHQQAAENVQYRLNEALECYLHQGVEKWLNTGIGDELCQIKSSLLSHGTAWLGVNVRGIEPKSRNPGQTHPGGVPPRGELFKFALPFEQHPIISGLLTAQNYTPPPIAAPEPPYPDGRGYNVPLSGECGPLCDLAFIGLMGTLCLPAIVALVVVAPEVSIGVGTVCATNPQLCGFSPAY